MSIGIKPVPIYISRLISLEIIFAPNCKVWALTYNRKVYGCDLLDHVIILCDIWGVTVSTESNEQYVFQCILAYDSNHIFKWIYN